MESLVRDVGFPCARDCAIQGWSNLRKGVVLPLIGNPEVEGSASDPQSSVEEEGEVSQI